MDNQFVKVGKILKSKGFDGTMRVAFDYDLLEDSFKALFLEKKGVYSPYLIEKLDFDGESALVKFTKIKSKEETSGLNQMELFLPEHIAEQCFEIVDWEDYMEYTVYDKKTMLGQVIEIYETKAQTTLEVKLEGLEKTVLIPFVKDWILNEDEDNRILYFELPEGLLDI
jgi:16S rRNA processing protein RimM